MLKKLRDKYWKTGFLPWVLTSCKPEFHLVPRALFTGLKSQGKAPWGRGWPEWLNTLIRLTNIAVVTEGIREI